MKAAYFEKTGSPDVIQYGELPKPGSKESKSSEIGDYEVLVKTRAVSVNPVDTYIRAGIVAMPLTYPFIPGADIAGTVEHIGSKVKRFQIGDRIWGSNQGLLGRQGTFAEYALIGEEFLYPTPENVSDETVAACALVGITAHLGLFRCAKLQANETVFVNGGSGGVGSMVIQMAKAVGARIITTAGSPEKADFVRSIGADEVILYKNASIADKVMAFTQKKGVNVWFEPLREPDFVRSVDLIAPNGRMVIMAGRQARPVFPVGPFYVKGLSLYGFAMFNIPAIEQQRCAEDMNHWFSEGLLRANIGARFPLSQAAQAHALQEANTLQGSGTLQGKIVLYPE